MTAKAQKIAFIEFFEKSHLVLYDKLKKND